MELEKNLQQQTSHTLTIYTYEGKKYILGWELNTLGYYGEIYDGEEKYYEVSDDNINEIYNNYRGEMKIEYEEIPKYNLKTTSVANPYNKGKNPFVPTIGKFTNRPKKHGEKIGIGYIPPTEKNYSDKTKELIQRLTKIIEEKRSIEDLKGFKNELKMAKQDAIDINTLRLNNYTDDRIKQVIEEQHHHKHFRKKVIPEELYNELVNLSVEELNALNDAFETQMTAHARR